MAKRMIGRDYKDIPQPVIKTFDERTVRLMQIEFEAKGVPYTGMINGNESKMVVSASNLSEIDRIIADINIGDRLKERLGENYKIGIAPDSRRRVTNTVTGEEELFDSFSAANYAYELREVEKANQEETKEQDEELFINESFRSYIDAMQESISQSDWNEAKNACDNINDLIDRALGIDKEDTSVSPVEETINRLSLEELTRAINTQENRILALAENRDFDGMRAAIELRDSLKKNYDERKSAEQSEVLTVDDVQTLRSIEPKRKSVQNMLDTEVAQVPRFEKQQAEKMGSKSAFEMRKEGGNDWRNDTQISVTVTNISGGSSLNNPLDYRKAKDINRGKFTNSDTGLEVYFSQNSINEITAKAIQAQKRGNDVNSTLESLYQMQDLIENAVCFDSELSVQKKNSPNSLFMHKFYTPVKYEENFYLAMLSIEEHYVSDIDNRINGTDSRVYNLKEIKMTPVDANRIFSPAVADSTLGEDTSNSVIKISIPQLYELVKTYDKNFFENPLAIGRTEREEEITLHAAAEDAIHTYQNELSNNKDQSRELTRSTNRNGDTVIGNKEFRYIADKKYISGLDHATANILIEKLNEIGLDLSSSFRADGTATVTVSGDKNKAKAQDIIDGLNTLEKDFEQLSDASNRLNEISDASDKKGITIDGKDGTWSVINTMTYGGKELSLLENDEQGEDVPYIILDGDNNVLSDKVYSFEDFTSVYTESEVALGLVSGKGITLTVAEFDNGSDIETAVFDDHLSIEDIERTQEYQDYAEKSEFEDITVRAEQYLIGFSEPSALTEEQAEYIRANLAAVKNDASLWDSKTATLNKFKDIADRQAERAIDINEALADPVGSPEEKAELQREFDSLTGAEQNFIPTRLFTVEQNDTVQYFTTDKTADELLTIAANSDSRTRHVSISDYIQKQDIPDKTAYTGLGAERIDVSAEYAASMWENGFEVYVDGEAVEPHTPDSSMELFRTDRAFSAQFGDVKKQQMIDFISNEIEELDMTMPEDKYVYVRDFIDEEEDDPFDWGDGQNVYLNITRALIEHKFDFIDDYLTSVKNDYDSIRAERAQDVLFEYKHYSPPSVEYTTVIDIPEYNFYVDLKNIDELYLENDYSYYEGGIDSDGHERKENYSRQTESLTITLNPLGTAVVERYDSKSEYNIVQTEYDLSDEVDVSELRDKVSNFIESSDQLSITSKKEEVSTDIQIHEQRELAALGEEERPEPTAVNQGISTITEGGEDLSALESITSAITDKKKTFVQNIARMSEEDIITFAAEKKDLEEKKGAIKADVQNEPIIQEDIDILRQLEPRKSVLNFTEDEVKLTEKWLDRFTEIGEKSPYYRMQNGDWRENEADTVPIIDVNDRNADFKAVSDDIKGNVIYRGECKNLDTDWSIQVSRRGLEDSLSHARQHNDTALYQMMYNVPEMIQNAVLLDTTVSEKNNANKANNTAFMHKLYSVCRLNDEPYLAKISVEEFLNGESDTLKRMYNVQDIKIEPLGHAAFTDKQLALSVPNGTDISISDLFKIVKTFDEDFYTNKRNAEPITFNSIKNPPEVGDVIVFTNEATHKGEVTVTEVNDLGTSFTDSNGDTFSIYDFHAGNGFDYQLIRKANEIEQEIQKLEQEYGENEKWSIVHEADDAQEYAEEQLTAERVAESDIPDNEHEFETTVAYEASTPETVTGEKLHKGDIVLNDKALWRVTDDVTMKHGMSLSMERISTGSGAVKQGVMGDPSTRSFVRVGHEKAEISFSARAETEKSVEQISLFGAVPADEVKTADNIRPYDVFRSNDGDKTVISVEDDGIRTLHTEDINGKEYAIEETVSAEELVNDNAFVGNDLIPDVVTDEPERVVENAVDYRITDDDFNAHGNKKERFRQNINAITTLKKIESEGRTATPEEQEILAKYVGWGGIPEAFDNRISAWSNEYAELKEILSSDEYAAARASTLNAHYTSPVVIETMYKALENMGFKGGKILDPSVGTGNFLGAMPEEMYAHSKVTGVELDSITGRIAGQLYQSADIKVQGFEKTVLQNNSFDVAISNVPFGDYKLHDKNYDNLNFHIHDYFFAKSLDKVHPGGIVAFVTSSGTMDKASENVRRYLAERADFLGAVRLPNTAFRNIAGTSVTSDIIFLQKRDAAVAIDPEKESWIGRKEISVADPRYIQPERNNTTDMKVGDRLHIKQRLWDYDRRVYFNVSYTAEIKDILSVSRNRTVSFQLGSIELDDSVDEYDKEQFKKNYLENDTCYIDQYSFCLKKEFNANSSRPDTSVEFLGNALEKEDQFTQLSINQYFADHPEMVVGHIEYDTNPKSSHMMCVADEDSDLRTQLEKAVSNISGEYRESAETKKEHENWLAAPAGSATYSYIIQDDKLYFRDGTEIMKPVNIKADDRDRIMGMVGLVEATKELLSAESSYSNDGDEAITELMQKLNDKYDAFVEKYGKIGDANNVKLFKNDSNSHLIKSLEKWDENLQTKERTYVGKADIMTNRLLYQTAQIDHVDTAADALVVSLSEKLDVDLEFMSHITGMSEEDLITELDGQIYQDPEQSMKWVTAAEYLSDNIYRKIEAAENAGMTHNAEVLRKYIPTPVEAQDIKVKLGSTWIPEQYYKQYLSETLHLSYDERSKFDVHYGETDGSWKIDRVKNKSAYNSYVNEVYGNSDMDAFQIAEAKLNLRIIEVKKPLINPDTGLPVFDNKGQVVKVVDANATKEVNLLAEKMERDFQNWIFKDPQRRDTLVQKYNKTFNCYRPREYDGSFLNFVGKNQNITLKPHQINAVARALMSGNTLLAHEVGAGKTYEMIAIAMEGKRLGQHKKSMICTPNHLTEQFGQSFRELYPGAKILVATTDDFSKNKRKDLIGKIATGDWDAVIIGHSQLGKLAVSSEEQQRFVDKRVSMIDRMINELGSAGAKSFSVKSAENMKQKLYSKLEKAMKREREDWISFEQLGIDKLFVDESQEFKNLGAISKTNVPGIGTTTSDRALNLKSITEYLDHKTGYNGTVFATGTPVSNSLSETYTLMEYLMEDRLDELDIDTFDKWASTFGEITTDSYLKADSSGQYEMKQKFTNIINAAEFHTIFRMMSDIKTADSLDIERPEAKVHTVVARPSMAQKEFIKQLGQRADDIQDKTKKVDPSEDNMLKITSDGRKCGLDMRCIDPYARDNPNSKLNLCVKNLIQTYNDTTDKKGTQLVFCDLATPQPEENPAKAILMKRNSGKYSPTLTCAYNDDKIAAIENRLNKRIENLKGKKQEDKDKIWAKNDSSNMNSLGFYADPKRQDFPDGIETGDIIVLTSPDEKAGISTNTAYEYNNGKYSKLSKEEMSARGIAVETEYHKQARFCAYDDIKKKLIAAGIPEKEIAFIHDAKDEEAKLALYDAMNKGDIRIMIGSSAKCGAGMNAQKHMVAIHHLDAPLRPSDMTQRDGRGVRQGNENSEIDIYRYVTDRTFDSYIYQILETKQKGFSQIMTDKPVNLRTFEDISEAALDYGKTKALCSGNPLIKEYADLQMEVANLRTAKTQVFKQRYAIEDSLMNLPEKLKIVENGLKRTHADIETLESAQEKTVTDDKGKKKTVHPITILGKEYYDNEKAGAAIAAIIAEKKGAILTNGMEIGEYKGFKVFLKGSAGSEESEDGQLSFSGQKNSIVFEVIGKDRYFSSPIPEPNVGERMSGITLRLINSLNVIYLRAEQQEKAINTLKQSVDDAQQALGELSFDDTVLVQKEARLEEVGNMLLQEMNSKDYTSTLYYSITDFCPQILDSDDVCFHYEVPDSESFMPLTIERHGDLVYMSHNYVQNDDLMNDPLVVMRLDEEAMKMKIISFENSGTGMYQRFDSHEISEMEQSCADYINETWCSDIENGGWVLTDKPMSELLAPHTYDMNGKADKPLTVEERSKMMGDWAEKVIVKRTDPEINISTSAR